MADEKEQFVHIDYSEQRADIPNETHDKCPKCGEPTEQGFGLAGGGFGVYTYCPKCEQITGKIQVEE